MDNSFYGRTWVQIDLSAFPSNYNALRGIVSSSAKIMAVVKADAYGHGVEMTAQTLKECGVDWFAVSSFFEARQLRHLVADTPILILGYTPPRLAKELCELNITQSVYSSVYASELAGNAANSGVSVNVHIKLDIGMSRIGFDASDDKCIREIESVCNMNNINPTGIFAHFPSADYDGDPDGEVTKRQFALFESRIAGLKSLGINFELCHCCNSAAAAEYPSMNLDMVREGICLYGLYPSDEVRHDIGLEPVMSLFSSVTMVKTVPAGHSVSYGGTYKAKHDIKVATVCIGYADGYPRAASNKGYMLVHGQKAPVIGRVCMDQLMLDVTGIDNVREGDRVTVFGRDGDQFIPVEQLSSLAGTINYETVCLITKRVPRVYVKNNEIVSVCERI